jgi:hypothetical protein
MFTTQAHKRAFLFSLREDGSPTCHPMMSLEKDGAPAFNTYRKSAKTKNLVRDPRAAVVLLDNWSVSPSTARCVTGVMEETAPIAPAAPPPDRAETGSVPTGVVSRVNNRVAEGKRIYLLLKER